MKKYRIVVKTSSQDPRKNVDVLDFNSYRSFNQRFDDIVAAAKTYRENVICVEKYFGNELVSSYVKKA